MIKRLISKDWFFSSDFKSYKSIDLPHDYAISTPRSPDAASGANNGYYQDARGLYVKHLSLQAGRHYVLDIDGAYMCTEVILNENNIAFHPYGYTPYLVDLTPFVLGGRTNKLKIVTSPMHTSSRWYNGNGIYRDVFLWEGGDIRIEPWDAFVYTVGIDGGRATLCTKFTVSADRSRDVNVRLSFIAPNGATVKVEETAVRARRGRRTDAECITEIDGALLWEPGAPRLYRLNIEIYDGDALCDEWSCEFGIRTVSADAVHGLHCLVAGGELMGIFSADPASDDQYTSDTAHAFKGRAIAIVRAREPGRVGVKVYSNGLAPGIGFTVAR